MGRPLMLELDLKHLKMVDFYFGEANFDKQKAATLAGFKWPHKYATRLFRKKAVVDEIERRYAENRERFDISEDKIMQELAKIGFSNLGNLVLVDDNGNGRIDLTKMTRAQRAALAQFKTKTRQEKYYDDEKQEWSTRPVTEVEFKFHDKRQALVDMGKHIGMFVEKVQVDATEDVIALLNSGRARVAKAKFDPNAPLTEKDDGAPATKH